jgi:hypothetical protein
VGMPLNQVAARGDGDDDTGSGVGADLPAHVLGDGLGRTLREVDEQPRRLRKMPRSRRGMVTTT